MSQVTKYKGFSKLYFIKILKEIIKIGSLRNSKKKILDYGCGEKYLEKLLKKKIINYDITPFYNETKNINSIKYDIIVMNHILMYLSKSNIQKLFDKIHKKNKKCKIIIGLGKQNILSKILKNLTFNFNAHTGTKSNYNEQLLIIKKNMQILDSKKNIFYMTDIFFTKFRKDKN